MRSRRQVRCRGPNLVDLIKYNVERPQRLVDITHVPMRQIADTPDGGLRIGALVTNATTAYDERIVARYPLLANAILSGASPVWGQIGFVAKAAATNLPLRGHGPHGAFR